MTHKNFVCIVFFTPIGIIGNVYYYFAIVVFCCCYCVLLLRLFVVKQMLKAGWVECDGREYPVMMYEKLFNTMGYVFGSNWYDDTFMIPDCTNKVLIHHSKEFIFGTTAGSDNIELIQNGILLPPHTTAFDTKFTDLKQMNNSNFGIDLNSGSKNSVNKNSTLLDTDIQIQITQNIVNYDNTVTKFNNMQRYLALNFLIVTHGKMPFDTNSTSGDVDDSFTTTEIDDPIDWDHSTADRRLYVGEIVIYANHQIPPGFVSCDGSFLLISQYNDLFQVIGFKYGGNRAIKQFKLPDCRGRAIMHQTDLNATKSNVGETGGEIISEMTANAIPPHSHGSFNFISQSS